MGASKQQPSSSDGESHVNTDVEAQLPVEEETAEGEQAPDGPPLDDVFEILKNSRRRTVIRYARENGGQATLSDLAERIAAAENDTTPERLTSSQRKRVYVGLYQCHLPKMDDAGVIEYNQSRGTVELTDSVEHFEAYLPESEDEPAYRWYRWYAGIAALGLVFVVGSVVLALPGLLVSGFLSGVVGLAAGCSLYHWRTEAT